MKANEKKFLAVLISITLIVVVIFIIRNHKNKDEGNNTVKEEFVEVLNDGTKLNVSSKLNQKKIVDGIEFGNIRLTTKNNKTVLLADVKNTNETETKMQTVDITLLDKDGNKILKTTGVIAPLQPKQSTQFNTTTTLDYANAYDFTVEIR